MKNKIKIIVIIVIILGITVAGIWGIPKMISNTKKPVIISLKIKQNKESSIGKKVYLKDASNNKIEYGSKGCFDIKVKCKDCNKLLAYKINMKNFENKPDNLKLYTDAEYTSELVYNKEGYTIMGGINLEEQKEDYIKTIYWKWEDIVVNEDGTYSEKENAKQIAEQENIDVKNLCFDILVKVAPIEIEENVI